MMEYSLKEQKEAFVTGHVGTTAWEVLLVCLSAPIGLACFQILPPLQQKWLSILKEALVIWFPIVLCQTNYLYPWGVSILAIQVALILIFKKAMPVQASTGNASTSKHLDYLTIYRSTLLYLTFVAILAVDFHVFPRRFAKTEISGYGLMDVGAASFVLSAGLVSPKARGKLVLFSIHRHLWHTLPLLIIGFVRLATNKGLEYQEHVSEYGVHWNFFFTLGALTLVAPLVPTSTPTWYLPILILTVYQLSLSFGLQTFIQDAPRQCQGGNQICNLYAANREGVLGCIGYLAVYLLGETIGHRFLWGSNKGLVGLTTMLWAVLLLLVHGLQIPVSRRSTNASFCVWAAAHNILLLTLIKAATSFGQRSMPYLPIVMETVNRHGLLMFLIANLLTGLVNITIPTLEVRDPWAFLIVFGYISVVGAAALMLDQVKHMLVGNMEKMKQK
jgi:phosphatidylinositol glycan class W